MGLSILREVKWNIFAYINEFQKFALNLTLCVEDFCFVFAQCSV